MRPNISLQLSYQFLLPRFYSVLSKAWILNLWILCLPPSTRKQSLPNSPYFLLLSILLGTRQRWTQMFSIVHCILANSRIVSCNWCCQWCNMFLLQAERSWILLVVCLSKEQYCSVINCFIQITKEWKRKSKIQKLTKNCIPAMLVATRFPTHHSL